MSRGASARLFVAVDPPLAAAEELAEWARITASGMRAGTSAKGTLRVLDARSLHLTLCFLGSRPVDEIEALTSAVAADPGRAFELSVGAPLWLPPRRPRALAVEIHDSAGELAGLQRHVSAALSSVCAWKPERRRFRPHITLARVRQSAVRVRRAAGSPRDGAREQALPATPRLSFAPEAVVLYRSWLASEGARYEQLASCSLARSA